MTSRRLARGVALAVLLAISLFLTPHSHAPATKLHAAVLIPPVEYTRSEPPDVEELRYMRRISAQTTTTTAQEPRTAPVRANRGVPRTRPTTPPTVALAPAPTGSPDFWRRLSNCESSTGLGGNGGGFFQFSPDTAAVVGYRAGQSYATQLLEAQSWAARIHPNEGSKSGWPHCWWVALRS